LLAEVDPEPEAGEKSDVKPEKIKMAFWKRGTQHPCFNEMEIAADGKNTGALR